MAANLRHRYESSTEPRPCGAAIGVLARPEDRPIVAEFFELFKTPWEFYRADGQYDVLIQTDGVASPHPASLSIVYSSQLTALDEAQRLRVGPARYNVKAYSALGPLPLAGRSVGIPGDDGVPDVVFEDTREPVAVVRRDANKTVVRVGYDLFAEIRHLLTTGQPAAHAAIPTLELHIELLRRWILIGSGLPLVEVPPVPEGSPFIVCLTHDVDHPSIRLHRFDHTMFGFLYRAVVGSILNVCRRRISFSALHRNLTAALALPLVHLGLVEDFWASFDRYLELEEGLGSTFFVIPTKNTPGRMRQGTAPQLRASVYEAADIADRVRKLTAAGCDVGLHGIDAWLDSASGVRERQHISHVADVPPSGVRMHWLYFDERTPTHLEEAGFTYDSTFGYNETVGFRAGTLQAFKPLSASRLLELPLHVMDTALFYPDYLDLTAESARQRVDHLAAQAERYGGALTINWHDRSLSPERQWDGSYIDLLRDLKRRGAWFPTAAHAIAWFSRRRSTRFDAIRRDGNTLSIAVSADTAMEPPGLTLRVHRPWPAWQGADSHRPAYTDMPFKDRLDVRVEF